LTRKTEMRLSDSFGQTLDFDIDPKYKKIGVNLSGGADSAILFYIVCDYLKQNDRTDTSVSVMSCANDLKHRWNVRKAADVINFTIDRLDFNPIDTHYSYYRPKQELKYFYEVEKQLFAENRVDLVTRRINKKKKDVAIVENIQGDLVDLATDALPIRTSDNKPHLQTNPLGNSFYTPFINFDKRFVAAMYDHYGVRDTLFPLTRSCEAIPDPRLGFDPAFEKEPCGECWWCLERKWAFGEFWTRH